MKITMNGLKVRPSSLRSHTVTSFNENNIWQSYKTRMYEKEINLIDVSFIFHRKLASRECILRGPKMLKIDFGDGWLAVPCSWLYGPWFLDCWAVGQWIKNSKMITEMINSLIPNDKILDWFKWKHLQTTKSMSEVLEIGLGRGRKHCG